MYNSCDYVNGVSTKECFHHLLDQAMELKEEKKYKECFPYFDVIRKCLGIDFSLFYEFDRNQSISCFESSGRYDLGYMHQEIEYAFSLFGIMVQDGYFSLNYLSYLNMREKILMKLIKTLEEDNCQINVIQEIKLENLKGTLRLLQERILEVQNNCMFLEIDFRKGK